MLLIQNNDLEINKPDINMQFFKIFVIMLESDADIQKELINLYDLFSFDFKYKAIESCLCMKYDCNKVASHGKFCLLHGKCKVPGCNYERDKYSEYCKQCHFMC